MLRKASTKDALNRHKPKNTLCCHFVKYHSCKYGDSCKFSHEIEHDDQADGFPVSFTGDGDKYTKLRSILSSVKLSQSGGEILWFESDEAREMPVRWKYIITKSKTSHSDIRRFAIGVFHELETQPERVITCLGGEMLKDFHNFMAAAVKLTCSGGAHTFQRCFVPLITLFTHSKLTVTSLDRYANGIYNVVNMNAAELIPKLVNALNELVTHAKVPSIESIDGYIPLTIVQMLMPVVGLITCLCLKSNSAGFKTCLIESVRKLIEVQNKWEDRIEKRDLYEDENLNGAESAYTLSCLRRKLVYLASIIDHKLELLVRGKGTAEVEIRPDKVLDRWMGAAVLPPDEDAALNSYEDYRNISIMPTAEEIAQKAPQTLPANHEDEKAHWLPVGPQRLLDTHFRLLREDMLVSLRTGVSSVLGAIQNSKQISNRGRGDVDMPNTDMFVYQNVQAKDVVLHKHHGVIVRLHFQHEIPEGWDSKEYFEKSKRFQRDRMICLVWTVFERPMVFTGTVVASSWNPLENKKQKDSEEGGDSDSDVFIWAQFPYDTLRQFLPAFFMESRMPCGNVLLEAHQILYESYRAVLQRLKEVEPSSLPFQAYLCPTDGRSLPVEVDPPLYAMAKDFKFDLSCLLKDKNKQLKLEIDDPTCHSALVENSNLDEKQAEATIQALTHEFVNIQGPPGTGKSFVGVQIVLSLLKSVQNLGPILVVCYTNHALDQFLRSLMKSGISNIVRIGSRSKDEDIQALSLHHISRSAASGRLYFEKCGLQEEFELHRRQLFQPITENELINFLADNEEDLYGKFLETRGDADGWIKVNSKKNNKRTKNLGIFGHWLSGDFQVESLEGLSYEERSELLDEWCFDILKERAVEALALQGDFDRITSAIAENDNVARIEYLKRAQIIGATTTGVAKHSSIIKGAMPFALVVEEAGEILEGHLLAALFRSVQHFISIGDHQQLRPKVAEHSFSLESKGGSKGHRLDMSMFERFQQDHYQFPLYSLQTQRRMYPSISDLIRMCLYPELNDSEEVRYYPEIKGLKDRLFFFDHSYAEDSNGDLLVHSKSNQFEAQMVRGLVLHLLKQGYNGEDIVVLTPYLGQLVAIKKELSKFTHVILGERDSDDLAQEGYDMDSEVKDIVVGNLAVVQRKTLCKVIRVSTVDNFQGEEATIVILSLVRNYGDRVELSGSIGFLKTTNRVNVALSRAKHGMYIIGQASLLTSKSKMWETILDSLDSSGLVGPAFRIRCENHPQYVHNATGPKDFELVSPDGGCLEPCQKKIIGCGHQCSRFCHADDHEHKLVRCDKPCARLFSMCGHACSGVCGDPCGDCKKIVEPITLNCGHILPKPYCYQSFQVDKIECPVRMEKVIPMCGHRIQMTCGMDPANVPCPRPCGEILACGHTCTAKCFECLSKVDENDVLLDQPVQKQHLSCKKVCGKQLSCLHTCVSKCHDGRDCPPCKNPCNTRHCAHGGCSHKCQDSCLPCIEPCVWACDHVGACVAPCGAPCTRVLCDERCSRELECGHQCPTVCGELCPDQRFCRECASDEVLEQVVDVVSFETYREWNMTESPVIVLQCGHVKSVETLDGLMNIHKFYYKNKDGVWRRDVLPPLPEEIVDIPRCTDCRYPIVTVRRYGRIINRAYMDLSDKLFIKNAIVMLANTASIVDKLKDAVTIYTEEISPKTSPKSLIEAKMSDLQQAEKVVSKCFRFVSYSPGQALSDAFENMLQKATLNLPVNALFVPQKHEKLLGMAHEVCLSFEILRTRRYSSLLEQANNTKIARPIAISFADSANKAFMHAKFGQQYFESTSNKSNALDVCMQKVHMELILLNFLKIIQTQKPLVKTLKSTLKELLSDCEEDMVTIFLSERCHALTSQILSIQAGYGLNISAERRKSLSELQIMLQTIKAGAKLQLNITKQEMLSIYDAMNLPSGHWYRCVNGHMYSIGECGMAMERSRCPECNETIGGESHELQAGNEHAEEFERLVVSLRGL